MSAKMLASYPTPTVSAAHHLDWPKKSAASITNMLYLTDAQAVDTAARLEARLRRSARYAALSGCSREFICQSARTFPCSFLKLNFAPYPRMWSRLPKR